MALCQCALLKPSQKSPHAQKLPEPEARQELALLLHQSLKTPNQGESAQALAHFVECWKTHFPQQQNLTLQHQSEDGQLHAYQVSIGTDGKYSSNPLSYFDEIYRTQGRRAKPLENHTREGLGATLVGSVNQESLSNDPLKTYYPPEGVFRPLTAVVRPPKARTSSSQAQRVQVELLCPLSQGKISLENQPQAIAANFSVPWAELIRRSSGLNRTKFTDVLTNTPQRQPQLYLMQPYHPEKQPLIMIHGLFDSPLVWADLSNELSPSCATR